MDSDYLKRKIDEFERLGLVELRDGGENIVLTQLGRLSIKVVFTGGVFDIIHPGHIHTIKESKQFGDILVISVARDKTATKMKGRNPINSESRRLELISSLRYVDLAILGSETNIFDTVVRVGPDIIALGYDQDHTVKHIVDGVTKLNLEIDVVRLSSPIPDIKSSDLIKNDDILKKI